MIGEEEVFNFKITEKKLQKYEEVIFLMCQRTKHITYKLIF